MLKKTCCRSEEHQNEKRRGLLSLLSVKLLYLWADTRVCTVVEQTYTYTSTQWYVDRNIEGLLALPVDQPWKLKDTNTQTHRRIKPAELRKIPPLTGSPIIPPKKSQRKVRQQHQEGQNRRKAKAEEGGHRKGKHSKMVGDPTLFPSSWRWYPRNP